MQVKWVQNLCMLFSCQLEITMKTVTIWCQCMNKMVVCSMSLSFLKDGVDPAPVPCFLPHGCCSNCSHSISSPSSFSAFSSNNLEDTSAILTWVNARNHCQNYICTPKNQEQYAHLLRTSLRSEGDTHCAYAYAYMRRNMHTRTDIWRYSFTLHRCEHMRLTAYTHLESQYHNAFLSSNSLCSASTGMY